MRRFCCICQAAYALLLARVKVFYKHKKRLRAKCRQVFLFLFRSLLFQNQLKFVLWRIVPSQVLRFLRECKEGRIGFYRNCFAVGVKQRGKSGDFSSKNTPYFQHMFNCCLTQKRGKIARKASI